MKSYLASLLILVFFALPLTAQQMEETTYEIEGMTMAITDMNAMLEFYANVFNMEFEEMDVYGSKLYSGEWAGMKMLFCPAEIAGNTAEQNRHQFDIIVSDLQATIDVASQFGGELMHEIVETDSYKSVGIYDPDKNSIVFKELTGN